MSNVSDWDMGCVCDSYLEDGDEEILEMFLGFGRYLDSLYEGIESE